VFRAARQTIPYHVALLTGEEQTKIDSDEDIAGKKRSGLNGGDWLVANK
jgi:hypothetical protein